MDIFGHAAYGATFFSRTGLGGGRRGAGRFDWTVWAAAGFSVLPDAASVGVGFADMFLRGGDPSFQGLPSYALTLYRITHSVVVGVAFVLLLRLFARPWALPALAWPLHALVDSVLHAEGRWQGPLFYPLFDLQVPGINWWEHGEVVAAYWAALPVLWLAIHLWRRGRIRAHS